MSQEDLPRQFAELAAERLRKIEEAVLRLESDPSEEVSRTALRELHSLKGEARMMRSQEITLLVHEMEELVRAVEPAGFALSAESTDALLAARDAVMVFSGAAHASTSPPDAQKLIEHLKARTAAELKEVEGRSRGGGGQQP